MDEHDFSALRLRLGDDHLMKRLRCQADRSLRVRGQGRGGLHFENLTWLMRTVELTLRLTRLHRRAQRNALAFTIRERKVRVCDVPPAFDGLRILQLSDPHLDGYPGFGRRIADALAGHRFDLVVITGDFRFYEVGHDEGFDEELAALLPALDCRLGVYGILGNHDFIEMGPPLERAGIRLLLNEAVPLDGGGLRLWLVGVDDTHFYGLHDFARALRGVPAGEPRLLLVHSPEVIAEAAAHGFCLYLTGHTHGGQICLPGGFAPYINARCRRYQAAGAWREGAMEGYTSTGVGSSGVFARFFCPPEVVIHELRAGG